MKIFDYTTKLNGDNIPLMEKGKSYRVDGRRSYTAPGHIVDFICDGIGIQNCAEEFVWCLCFDSKLHLVGCFEVSHGTVDYSVVTPREIFQKALMIGAVRIAITHNHPNGDPTPSEADMEVTRRVKEACEIIGVELVDHLIVTKQLSYYSFKGCGTL